jgi:hypothetical protein
LVAEDLDLPNATALRLLAAPGGGLRIEVEANDGDGCGVESVSVLLDGEFVQTSVRSVQLSPSAEDPGLWVADLPPSGCGLPGELVTFQVIVRDRAHNQREYQRTQAGPLVALVGITELPAVRGTLAVARPSPQITAVRVLEPPADVPAAVRIEVDHDGPECVPGGSVRVIGPEGDTRALFPSPEASTAGTLAFDLEGTSCLAEGPWTVGRVILTTAAGGVTCLLAASEGPPPPPCEVPGAEPIGVFEVRDSGLSAPLPLGLAGVDVEPTELPAGRAGRASIDLTFDPDGCQPSARVSTRLRRLERGDRARRLVDAGLDETVELSACAPAGEWWVQEIEVWDVSGARWEFSLGTGVPGDGYDGAPEVPPAGLIRR